MSAQADYLRNPVNPAPDDDPGIWEGIKGLKRLAQTKVLREAPDIAATFLTGMAGQAAGGWQGLTKLATGQGLDAAVKAIEDTQRQVTYTPREEGGQEGVQAIGEAVEPIGKWAKETFADPAGERWPAIGAALVAAPEILPGPKGVKAAVGAAGKAAKAAKGAERGVAAAEAAAAPVATIGPAGESVEEAARVARNAATVERMRAERPQPASVQAALREPIVNEPAPASEPPAAASPDSRLARAQAAATAAEARGEGRAAVNEAYARELNAPSRAPESTPLLVRLQEARDADAAWRDNPSTENATRRRVAIAELQRGENAPLPGSTEALQRERMRAAALRGENTPAQWVAAADAPDAPQFHDQPNWTLEDQLHAAQRAYDASPTEGNLTYVQQLYAAIGAQRGTPSPRAAALREEPDTSAALDAAHEAHRANPTPETEAALQAAVDAFVREDTRRTPVRDDAGGTDWTPEREPTPPAGSAPTWWTPHLEQRLGEVDAGEWLTARRGVFEGRGPTEDALDARSRVLAGRLVSESSPEYDNTVAYLRQRLTGEPAPRASTSRQSVLRHQKELPGTARRVDPGWEHQKLIPGFEPLTPAEGQTNRMQRLQQIARERGLRTRELRRGDPAMNRESVMAFYEGGRDNPDMFQYGVDPVRTGEVSKHGTLEDFVDVYNQRVPEARIEVDRVGGDGDIDYSDIQVDVDPEPLRHGYGEVMRNRHGEHIEEKKTHEAGDVPVYDERGDIKWVKPDEVKYVAEGGEPVRTPRDRWGGGGDPKYRYVKSEGGEVIRDEHGDIKTDATHDEEAYYERVREAEEEVAEEMRQNQSGGDDEIRMTAAQGGEFKIQDFDREGRPSMYTGANKGPYGAPMYQALFNQFSHSGGQIRDTGLTGINQMRMLANVNSNFARTGRNPRDIHSTGSGDLPREARHTAYAEGPEIWRSESDEALKRVQQRGGKPERMGFDPEWGFTLDGLPATAEDLKSALSSMSPGKIGGEGGSGVSLKVLMRSAVFDWLRDAKSGEAARVAKEWGKKYGPLFGVAPIGLAMQDEEGRGFTVQDALREKAEEKTR